MIIRILNEGQFKVDDSTIDELNVVDGQIEAAVDAGDEEAFQAALDTLHAMVLAKGEALGDEYLGESDLVLPDPDSTIKEVKHLLGDEGLIPD